MTIAWYHQKFADAHFFPSNRGEYLRRKFSGFELERRRDSTDRWWWIFSLIGPYGVFTSTTKSLSQLTKTADLFESVLDTDVINHGWSKSELHKIGSLCLAILKKAANSRTPIYMEIINAPWIESSLEFKDVGTGVTGSKFAIATKRNGDRTCEAILKAMNPPADSCARIAEKIAKQLLSQDRPTDNLINGDVKQKMVSEVACALLAQHLGFNAETRRIGGHDLVPPTTLIAHDGKLHSMQIFVPDAMEASLVFERSSVDPRIAKFQKKLRYIENESSLDFDSYMYDLSIDEIKLFQLFVVLDFLIRNQDRHDKNWLIKLNDKGKMVGIIAIDNGNSLPAKHLSEKRSFFIEKNQYSWANLALSKIPFTNTIKEFIKKITYEKINDILEQIAEDMVFIIACTLSYHDLISTDEEREAYKVVSAFRESKEMRKGLKDRLSILKSNEIRTPAYLANYKYKEDFVSFDQQNSENSDSSTGHSFQKDLTG